MQGLLLPLARRAGLLPQILHGGSTLQALAGLSTEAAQALGLAADGAEQPEASDVVPPQQARQESGVASTSAPSPLAFGPRLVQPLQRGPAKVARQEGIVHVHNTSNNCILVLTDKQGQIKTWTSGGTVGFKNSGKSTPLAAEAAAAELARRALSKGFYSVVVKLKGAGRNKQYAVQALAANGVNVTQLQEVTAIPYNGCRLPKKRRT